ncbi:hypothetical protein [Pseudothauera rhizosphaerae]|uniref:Uncharacterized protein n=1 Tax=Pseudothauera rhizosphaerae TaxID=2565932 RepID=A0A4S4AQP9_9RHOO|nr:hypothetical protein [Pseudothauera rhizosphaerae]THF61617.1 hypothetical protein E6O51_09180 [Pseudothauera rhizosphaerae]
MNAPPSPDIPGVRDRAARLCETLASRLAADWPDLWQACEAGRPLPATAIPPAAADPLARHELASLLREAGPERAPIALPASVTALYAAEHERILAALEDEGTPVAPAADRWKKNHAILTGQLIPVGAEFAQPASGIPRSLLLRGGFAQQLRMLRTVALETGGFRPLLELHAHPDSLATFHEEGWRATYHRLAEILQLNPAYRGVMASSWFRDPALRTISPRLGYLRDYPERHGARMFLTGVDRVGTSGALARSPTRQRLFREGAYVPRIHMMVWPRKALLRWHEDDR